MKKFFKYIVLSVLAAACASCAKQEPLAFDHESPAFDTKDGVILIEAIMPSSTLAEDEIYICGPFNGGDAAVDNIDYQLEKSDFVSLKWGVYVNPANFVDGKTLADGFWFYSKKEGREVTVKNAEAVHTLDAVTGERYNVYVDRWASYYSTPEEETLPEHDGVRIYINDQTGWSSIALYQWGDVNDFGGGWPGMAVSGTETLAGKDYKYFQYTADIVGLAQNLIFNDNGGGTQLADYAITFDGTTDYFLDVTADGVTEGANPLEGNVATFPAHDGTRIYVVNQTGWDAVTLYQWGDVNDFGGGWPGASVTGTYSTGGVDYIYFEFGADIIGLAQHLIFSNNGDSQLADYDLTFDGSASDYFILITLDGAEAFDPGSSVTPGPVDPVDPPINPDDYYSLYIQNNTGWNALAIYSWGSFESDPDTNVEAFGGWPGATAYETITVADVNYERFLFSKDAEGSIAHLIFNNNDGGVQFNGPDLLLKDELFLCVTVTNDAVEIVDPRATYSIYVKDNSGWEVTALYAWGGAEIFGGWPGAQPVEELVIGGETWKRFEVNSSFNGLEEHLIYNNGNGAQFDGSTVVINKDYWFEISASEETVADVPSYKIYVDDQTGWDALTLYAWGDVELFGGWPGALPAGKENVSGKDYTVFTYPIDAIGKAENLIFNNNGAGSQLADYPVTLAGDMTLEISDSGASVPGKFSIYVQDESGWGAIALYAWGDSEVFGSWPGALPAETLSFSGKPWKRFDVNQADNGKNENLILNNNNGGEQFDLASVTLSKDFWYTCSATAGTEVDAPKVRVYVDNQTGWDAITLYQWGDVNNFGGDWPGAQPAGNEVIGGVDYVYFEFGSDILGLNQNLIFNNNGAGNQLPDYAVTFTQDLFLTVTASAVTAK